MRRLLLGASFHINPWGLILGASFNVHVHPSWCINFMLIFLEVSFHVSPSWGIEAPFHVNSSWGASLKHHPWVFSCNFPFFWCGFGSFDLLFFFPFFGSGLRSFDLPSIFIVVIFFLELWLTLSTIVYLSKQTVYLSSCDKGHKHMLCRSQALLRISYEFKIATHPNGNIANIIAII